MEFTSDKFEGKLRIVGRSSPNVNAAKSECDGAIRIATKPSGAPKVTAPQIRTTFDSEESIKAQSMSGTSFTKGSDDAATTEIEIQGFAILRSSNEPFKHKLVSKQSGRVCTISGTLSDIDKLADHPQVVSIRLANTIRQPVTESHIPGTGVAVDRIAGAKAHANIHKFGKNILVGIIDVGGFHFSHPDFLDGDGNTRFARIWDQGGDFYPEPSDFDYGSEIRDTDMNAAIAASPQIGLPPHMIVPQTQMSPGSHGTHVTSIAAGNSGLCKNAQIAAVLLSLPPGDNDRRLSFYNTTRIVHAVDYLFALGEELGVDAVTINISLGTNGGPHDNSSPMSRWIDAALTKPGRSVSVAAGNAGQQSPLHAQDIGFALGRIHTSGHIAAAGLEQRINWVVVGDQIEDISENELEIWYEAQDRFSVQILPPNGTWSAEVEPGQFIRNEMLPDGTFLSIFNELYDTGNGCNKISIYLSPFLESPIVGITPGTWTVRLIGNDVRDGRYHGWIERDDPQELGRQQDRVFWQFPSFFGGASNVDNSSVSTLACGDRIIAVANYNDENESVNISSSQGPTRDNRQKPDISAPGTLIIAANGFDEDVLWVVKTGTSMASPFVAGAVGLMQAASGQTLTASQILGILRRTALPLPGHRYQWRNDAGFGAIDLAAALEEARNSGSMQEVVS